MTNKQIARALRLTASLIELTGGNDFRARAFSSASRRIDGLERPATELIEEGRLDSLPGIGLGLSEDIESLVRTGTFDGLEELMAAVPPGLMDVLRIKGLGPKKVRVLWQQLGVTTLEELETTVMAGEVAALPGFGKKSEERILEEIHRVRSYQGRWHHATTAIAAEPLFAALREAAEVYRAEAAGALRRGLEVLEEIDVVVAGEPDAIAEVVRQFCADAEEGVDDALVTGTLPDGMPVRVYHADADDFVVEWFRRTGSKAHLDAFEAEHPLPEAIRSEAALYEVAGLAFIPPELREGGDELGAAREDAIPRLIDTGDLKGTLHNHTTASDGVHSLRRMAEAARAMGYEYLGICDHSRSLVIANGLSVERLQEQAQEIRALNEEFASDGGSPFRIFQGTECDILQDGSLDYPDEVLVELDLVVASIHTGFNMTEAQATERLIRAVEHPLVDILGHMTGRLLLRREGYPVDHLAVIEACAAHGTAIEINANPYRLDMDWRFIREATQRGVTIAINPDAHSVEELRFVQWGVGVARKGWLTAEQCLNALPADGFERWLAARREAAFV